MTRDMKWPRLAFLVPLLGAMFLATCIAFAGSSTGRVAALAQNGVLRSPSREMRVLMAELSQEGGNAASDLLPRAKAALGRAPLEEEPFVLAALASYNVGQFDKAAEFIGVARHRHPRSREARNLSFDINLARGDIAGAVEDLEVLMRVAPDQRMLTKEALVLLAVHPETGEPAVNALRDRNTQAMAVIELARSGREPAKLIDAIKAAKSNGILKADQGLVTAITNSVIQSGQINAAYNVWATLMDKPAGRPAFIRDEAFTEHLPPPFGWDLRSGRDGYAALQSPGLMGEAYGRRRTQLARQLLVLPRGNYRLQVIAGKPSAIVDVIVQCFSGFEIGRISLKRAGINTDSFAVPESCNAQWVEVVARASDPPAAIPISIKSIAIRKEAQ